jgi:hypothetical protein
MELEIDRRDLTNRVSHGHDLIPGGWTAGSPPSGRRGPGGLRPTGRLDGGGRHTPSVGCEAVVREAGAVSRIPPAVTARSRRHWLWPARGYGCRGW